MSDQTVLFQGERFRIRKKIPSIAFLRFAHIASKGVDSNELEGMDALWRLLASVIAKDEWTRFEQHAEDVEADDDDLMQVVMDVVAVRAGRPTVRPSDSSDGPTTTPPNSVDDSSLRVVHRLEQEGRPDLALMVHMAQEAKASVA